MESPVPKRHLSLVPSAALKDLSALNGEGRQEEQQHTGRRRDACFGGHFIPVCYLKLMSVAGHTSWKPHDLKLRAVFKDIV